MCSLPYAMTANKTYLSTYFPFKTSLFIKRMSLINKVNFKKCFSENYKRMRLTTRVYGIVASIHGNIAQPYCCYATSVHCACSQLEAVVLEAMQERSLTLATNPIILLKNSFIY